jgi:ParB-like chromosome segregation protein Spo0J
MSTSKLFTDGSRSNVFHVDPKAVVLIGLDTAHKVGEHVLYDDRVLESVERSFIDGVKAVGILEPVLVRKSGGNMEVVFGRKRTIALRIANAELIAEGKEPHKLPILPERKGTSDLEVLQKLILENEARRNTSPMQKALRLQHWFDLKAASGVEGTDGEAAVFFDTTATTIRNWKKLLSLDTKVQGAILQGKISANAAADLSDLEPAKQVEKLRELQGQVGEGKQISTAQTEGERKTRKGSVAATAYSAPSISKIRKIAENPDAIEKLSKVTVSVASLLKFISGLSDGSDIPELKAMIEATPARGNAVSTGERQVPAQA